MQTSDLEVAKHQKAQLTAVFTSLSLSPIVSGQQIAQGSAGGSRNLEQQAGPARPGRSENSDSRAAANPAAAGERVEAQQSAQVRGKAALIPLKTTFVFNLLSNFTERKG